MPPARGSGDRLTQALKWPCARSLPTITSLEVGHRVDPATQKAVAKDPLVVRADEWTEILSVYELARACSEAAIPIRRVHLGVRPAPAARKALGSGKAPAEGAKKARDKK